MQYFLDLIELGFTWDVKVSLNTVLKDLFYVFTKVLAISASKDHSIPIKTTFSSFSLHLFVSYRELS